MLYNFVNHLITMKINPYEIVDIRRKIKKYEETGIQETMKLVKKLREWKL